MVICVIDSTHYEVIIPGMLILGSAITCVTISFIKSCQTRGLLPKGYKENKSFRQKLDQFS